MFNLSIQQNQLHDLADLLKAFTAISNTTVESLHSTEAVYITEAPEEAETATFDLDNESFEVFPLNPSGKCLRVVACDMSTVHVAETSRGGIWAVRGSIVVRTGRRISAGTIGPLLYMVSPSTVDWLVGTLNDLLGCGKRIYVNIAVAPKVISNLFERVLQLHIASKLEGGILLLDGSLISGPADSPAEAVERIVDCAKASGQGVAAFSKTTTLMLQGKSVCSLIGRCRPPYVVKIPISHSSPWKVRNGSVYVSHFSGQHYPFRVDVTSKTTDLSLFNDLLSSDTMVYGYPETLIISHQLAKLNKLDVLSIRACLENTIGVKLVGAANLRSSLFTPISKG